MNRNFTIKCDMCGQERHFRKGKDNDMGVQAVKDFMDSHRYHMKVEGNNE